MDFYSIRNSSVLEGLSFVSVDHIDNKYSVAKNCGGNDNSFMLNF
jgi:hypothetical protein